MTTSARSARHAVVLAALVTVPLALAGGQASAERSDAQPAAAAPFAVPADGATAPVVLAHPAVADAIAAVGPVQRRTSSVQRAAAQAQAVPTTCAIGGIVWDDSSQDGLKTTGETGVAGSEVVLRWDGSTVLKSVMTGSDGRYLFDDLQCGPYDVGFTLPSGYSWTAPALGNGSDDSQATDPGPSFIDGVTPAFTVGPGQPLTRRAGAADAVSAAYVDDTVDAGMFVTGSPAVVPAAPAPAAPAAPVPAAPVPAVPAPAPAEGELAYTGTATENLGWTGAALLASGVVLVAATRRRPQPATVTG